MDKHTLTWILDTPLPDLSIIVYWEHFMKNISINIAIWEHFMKYISTKMEGGDSHKVKILKVKATIHRWCSLCPLYFYLCSNVSAMPGKIRKGKILRQINNALLWSPSAIKEMDSTHQHSHRNPVCSFPQFTNHLRNLWVCSPYAIEQNMTKLSDDAYTLRYRKRPGKSETI